MNLVRIFLRAVQTRLSKKLNQSAYFRKLHGQNGVKNKFSPYFFDKATKESKPVTEAAK